MRDAIHYLLSNPKEAKRMGQNARQRIAEKFNLDTYVRKIADVLVGDELAGERSIASLSVV